METVLVAGATGYAGRHLAAALHAGGYRVRAVVRDVERARGPGAYGAPALAGLVDEWVEADVARVGPGVMEGVERVVSALGVTRQKADPWDIDYAANLRLLELAEAAGAASFLYVGVMNAQDGTSALMRAKAAFEQALRRSDLEAQIVNPSAYFSDLTAVLDLARRRIAVRVGAGDTRIRPIHGADLAGFCVDRMGARGTWDVGGPDVFTYREVVELAFDALGADPRWIVVPPGVLRAGVWAADRMGPRVSSLTRFFAEGLQHDGVGAATGTRRLRDYFGELAGPGGG
ncbi:SDR family oxidoreductase [Zhihengliuella salsuginis]|uniref:Divinyl chlorophyllide a 8-vinyl-reductase, chloroplastic n=1 Tax=Zhihengliuella salsuginis TaxID=578222 RepID=A0ABQ3GC05_9MICC|nr:NAD(P)H-binding protein [Zhihengliuella salsuginis]GHC99993.1 3-beta hydroxysteroid dehydrogenase [Zhihengliuella salsuginis]